MTDANDRMRKLHFGIDPADNWIQINPKIWNQIQDHFSLREPKCKGSGILGMLSPSASCR